MTRPSPRLVYTKPTKAQLAVVGSFLTAFLGSIITARSVGADWSWDLLLNALYVSVSGSGITGAAVYVKRNKIKRPGEHAEL